VFLGRIVRPGQDPEWTKSDRLFALAWMIEQADNCSGCGRPWSETTDPEALEDYDAHIRVCHACAERDRHRRRLGKQDEQVDGGYILVTRRPDA
jgi:hypothetical protein